MSAWKRVWHWLRCGRRSAYAGIAGADIQWSPDVSPIDIQAGYWQCQRCLRIIRKVEVGDVVVYEPRP